MFRLLRLTIGFAGITLLMMLPSAMNVQARGICSPPCADRLAEPCVGELECYDLPNDEPDSTADLWSGYNDGRLNPHPDEYYSVWCEANTVKVYRAVPETRLVDSFPIERIAALEVGESADLGGFMTLVRNSEDTITIYGSSGNGAPAPGEKAFSLSACQTQGGYAVEHMQTAIHVPAATPTPETAAHFDPNIGRCWMGDTRACAAARIPQETVLDYLCSSSLAGVLVPGGIGLRRWRRHKRSSLKKE